MRVFQVYSQATSRHGNSFFKTVGLVNIPGGPGDEPGADEAGREAVKVYADRVSDTFAVRWLNSDDRGGITILRRVNQPTVERVTL